MAKKSLPDSELLRKLLRYDPETGKLYWRERPREMFQCDRSCSVWNAKYAGGEAFTADNNSGYRHGRIFRCAYVAHRIAWKIFYGHDPDEIDHINGVRDDNRIANLRNVDHKVNGRNVTMCKRNTSGITGVSWNTRNNNWRAYIKTPEKVIYLGSFSNIEDAAKARAKAEKKYGYHPNHGRHSAATGGASSSS